MMMKRVVSTLFNRASVKKMIPKRWFMAVTVPQHMPRMFMMYPRMSFVTQPTNKKSVDAAEVNMGASFVEEIKKEEDWENMVMKHDKPVVVDFYAE